MAPAATCRTSVRTNWNKFIPKRWSPHRVLLSYFTAENAEFAEHFLDFSAVSAASVVQNSQILLNNTQEGDYPFFLGAYK